jgi:hypothetical protein
VVGFGMDADGFHSSQLPFETVAEGFRLDVLDVIYVSEMNDANLLFVCEHQSLLRHEIFTDRSSPVASGDFIGDWKHT